LWNEGEASAEDPQKIMNNGRYIVGYCDLHEEPVDQGAFEYKGCWTCSHFHQKNWPYISVKEAAERYGVCKKTIYKWIKQGKLKARLFEMGRGNLNVPKKFYAILPGQARPQVNK
jgi:excisionase family DNA binding protein